jgi:tetratricopeptide (TPR) repeat protein
MLPAFVNGGAQALQKLLLGGALAVKEGRHVEAIGMQKAAVALCGTLGMVKAQLINSLVLGSYFMAAQSPREARKTYEQVATEAQAQQLKDEEAQSHLALGMLDSLEGQHQQSMSRYLKAGDVAEASGNHVLAIECWRTAGQLAFNLKAYDAAIQPWLRATNVAGTMDPKQVKQTGAAECARGVAAVFRSRGQLREAEKFEQDAFRYEHGLELSAPVPSA